MITSQEQAVGVSADKHVSLTTKECMRYMIYSEAKQKSYSSKQSKEKRRALQRALTAKKQKQTVANCIDRGVDIDDYFMNYYTVTEKKVLDIPE